MPHQILFIIDGPNISSSNCEQIRSRVIHSSSAVQCLQLDIGINTVIVTCPWRQRRLFVEVTGISTKWAQIERWCTRYPGEELLPTYRHCFFVCHGICRSIYRSCRGVSINVHKCYTHRPCVACNAEGSSREICCITEGVIATFPVFCRGGIRSHCENHYSRWNFISSITYMMMLRNSNHWTSSMLPLSKLTTYTWTTLRMERGNVGQGKWRKWYVVFLPSWTYHETIELVEVRRKVVVTTIMIDAETVTHLVRDGVSVSLPEFQLFVSCP